MITGEDAKAVVYFIVFVAVVAGVSCGLIVAKCPYRLDVVEAKP